MRVCWRNVRLTARLRAGFQRSHFGHHRIRALLQREAALERTLPSHRRRPISTANQEDWPIVCQYSSCGSLASNWVRAELLKSMGAKHSTKVYHVVPSVEQVGKSPHLHTHTHLVASARASPQIYSCQCNLFGRFGLALRATVGVIPFPLRPKTYSCRQQPTRKSGRLAAAAKVLLQQTPRALQQ